MDMNSMLEAVKKHPDYEKVGMILCHNGIVRGTSRDGRKVSGLRLTVDHVRLKQVIETYKKGAGIIEVLVEIAENRDLAVGDDVMFLVVAGDIRENVIATLTDALNDIKATVTDKTQFYSGNPAAIHKE